MNEHYPSDAEIAEALKKAGSSGFGINSWGDAQSMLFVAIMLLGGIAWGLKLEWRGDEQTVKIDSLRADISAVAGRVDKGILPITAVELEAVKERVAANQDDIRAIRDVLSTVQNNQIILRQHEIIRQSDDPSSDTRRRQR